MYCENCGKVFPDGAVFCNECGSKLVEGQSQQSVDMNMYGQSQQSMDQNMYGQSQQGMNQNMYGQPQQGMNQNMYGQPQQGMNQNMYGQPQQGMNQNVYGQAQQMYNQNFGQNPYDVKEAKKRYKKSVLPFKLVGAFMNFISLIIIMLIGFAAIGIEEDDSLKYLVLKKAGAGDFENLGVIAVLVALFMLVLFIFGICLPAKGGVISNIISMAMGVLTCILNFAVTANTSNNLEKIGAKDTENLLVGLNFMAGIALFFMAITLIMSIIGMLQKKNY